MAHLPASPTARRKEEEARRLERLRDMERKLDTFHRGGVAKAASSTPLPQTPSRSPEEEALQNLARNLEHFQVWRNRGIPFGLGS
jgi:hypothetical protein